MPFAATWWEQDIGRQQKLLGFTLVSFVLGLSKHILSPTLHSQCKSSPALWAVPTACTRAATCQRLAQPRCSLPLEGSARSSDTPHGLVLPPQWHNRHTINAQTIKIIKMEDPQNRSGKLWRGKCSGQDGANAHLGLTPLQCHPRWCQLPATSPRTLLCPRRHWQALCHPHCPSRPSLQEALVAFTTNTSKPQSSLAYQSPSVIWDSLCCTHPESPLQHTTCNTCWQTNTKYEAAKNSWAGCPHV